MSAREDIRRLHDIFADILSGYCESCRMAPCVCPDVASLCHRCNHPDCGRPEILCGDDDDRPRSASTSATMPMSAPVDHTVAHPLVLSFEDSEIRGLAWDYGGVLVVEATDHPRDLPCSWAKSTLLGAIRDGRCKLPEHVRARLDRRETVVR